MKKTKSNALVLMLLTVFSIIVSRSCCAQPNNGCRLLELENDIEGAEEKIRVIYWKIYDANKDTIRDKDEFYKRIGKPKSVWTVFQVPKPSEYLKLTISNCEESALRPEYETNLNKLKNAADTYLEEAIKKQSKFSAGISNTVESGQNRLSPKSSSNPKVIKKIKSISPPETPYSYHPTSYNENNYMIVIVDPRSSEIGIDFMWKDNKKVLLESFKNANDLLDKQGKIPLMVTNAGIFDVHQVPMGLFYSDSKKMRKFNANDGEGNFFLDPAGVFMIEKDGTPKIMNRDLYKANIKDTIKIRNATQSGPMLIDNGVIHPAFQENSTNLNIRSGVGILPEPDNRVVFVISKELVNFYEFALVFKGLGCENALFLDGAISKMFIREDKQMRDVGGKFAGMIAVYKKKPK